MKCDYCATDIPPGTETVVNGKYFCNSLHRYSWQQSLPLQSADRPTRPSSIGSQSRPGKGDQWKKQFALILVALGVVLGSTFGTQMVSALFNSAPSVDDQLMQFASAFNKSCPVMIDKETRLDNALGGPNKTIFYNYTMVSLGREEIDTTRFQEFLRPRILNDIKTNKDMTYLRDRDVSFVYKYHDKTGLAVCDIRIGPEHYK